MEFLDVFNTVVRAVVPRRGDAPDAISYEQEPVDLGIDSLDMVMVIAVLTDIYGIPDDVQFDDVSKFTVGTVWDYVQQHKTKEPESLDVVREAA